jgi:hypothetical protein
MSVEIVQKPREGIHETDQQTHTGLGIMAMAAGIAVVDGDATWRAARAQEITDSDSRVVATNIPGASGVRQLFVSEPFHNTIAVINLVNFGTAPNQVGLGSVSRIRSHSLNLLVDLATAKRDPDNVNWASNTTLDQGSDFYVADRGDNTIVRMHQDGSVVAVRRVRVDNHRLDDIDVSLNGIATSLDGTTIYVTVMGRSNQKAGGVLALPAF